VLYEMTTGRRAFSGETYVARLAAILREEPTPASQLAPETPRELERVINRCLRKNPERRFQHMADLKVALEELKEESESGALAPAEPAVRVRRKLPWAAGAFLLAAALGLAAWFGLLRPPAASPVPKVSMFTALAGTKMTPAFSPDGRQVAFTWDGEKQDNFDIYVQLVDEATPRRLTTNPASDHSPAWSPDDLRIAFLRDTPTGTDVVMIPAAGGTEQRLHVTPVTYSWSDDLWGLAWSPNGTFLAMIDRISEQDPDSIFLLNIDTREEQRLTTPPSGSWDGMCAFSPDGRSLAFLRGRDTPQSDIYVLPVSDSGEPRAEPRRMTRENSIIYGLDWTGDGRGIVFSSIRGGVAALWRVAASGGQPERLPVGGNNAYHPSISRKGNRLAYTEAWAEFNIWRVAVPGTASTHAAAPIRLTASRQVDQQAVFSPDGRKIAWSSVQSGSYQIWLSNSDGSEPIPLTHHAPPGAAEPQWSPDGRQIAFNGYGPGPRHVYLIGAEGGKERALTTGDFDEWLSGWSRDGKWVYFVSNRGEGDAIWKVPAGGGSPVPVARNGWGAVESLNGKFVYYNGPEESIWKVPAGGGSPILLARKGWRPVESFDGRFVYYNGPNASIWKVPAAGGEAVRVLITGKRALWTLSASGIYVLDPDAKGAPTLEFFSLGAGRRGVARLPGKPDDYAQGLSDLSLSPDGGWILYPRRDSPEAQIMLVENFR